MAAKKATRSKKVTKKTSSTVKRSIQTNNWWEKYSYTPTEFLSKVILFIVLVYALFQYRGLLIAASVNGQPISRVSVISELESASGNGVLENLINQELIRQKAESSHVQVSKEDIDNKIAEIETSLTASGQTLDSVLAMQGMTRESLEGQIKTQVMVEKLLEGDVTVSDEDVTTYMTENKEYLPTDKTEEEVKNLVREQLKQQKLSERFSTWITELKNEADIKSYVKYYSTSL